MSNKDDDGIPVVHIGHEPLIGGKSETDILRENHDALIKAATDLREAQKNYMADRGNEAKGKIVGEKATALDKVLECCK